MYFHCLQVAVHYLLNIKIMHSVAAYKILGNAI